MNYLDRSIIELNELLKRKEIKPIDLVEEAFSRIEKEDYQSFITLNKENARKEAIALEQLEVDNPLFGIPIAIKDNIVTKGLKTTCASLMLEDFIPVYDATVIEKIKEKHMIIIGKTNMDEFAMGSTGETSAYKITKNPWDPSLVPGGSSSGSAVSVSARLVPLALGSDTGGSIRQPSSFCGIVGMKPTYGRVSRYGLIAFASSLDQIGPMSRNVYENALLLNIISGRDEHDLTSSNEEVPDFTHLIGTKLPTYKIALPKFYMSKTIDSEVREIILNTVNLLKQKGMIVEEVDIPYLEYSIPLYQVIALSEASSNLARFDGIKFGHSAKQATNLEEFYQNSRIAFGPEVKRRIMIGTYVLSGKNADIYYNKALKLRHELTNQVKKVLTEYDFIIGPTNTNVAYPLGTKLDDALKSFYDDLLTIPVNMTGLPAISMPVGLKGHMPVGMQIIGSTFSEDKIYHLASMIESELNLTCHPKGENVC